MCPPNNNMYLLLIADVHPKFCNGFGIVQCNFGNVFGGYTSKKWTSTNRHNSWGYICDKDAFLFVSRSNNSSFECPQIFKCLLPQQAIWYHTRFGPVFGAGHDILINNACNKETVHLTDIVCNKKMPMNACTQKHRTYLYHADTLCGGNDKRGKTYYFSVVEYEVFEITIK